MSSNVSTRRARPDARPLHLRARASPCLRLLSAGTFHYLLSTPFQYGQHSAAKGYMARGGSDHRCRRDSRDENDQLWAGRTPAVWKQKPAKLWQKDRDARWTKKM
jgi:hypothetical protein